MWLINCELTPALDPLFAPHNDEELVAPISWVALSIEVNKMKSIINVRASGATTNFSPMHVTIEWGETSLSHAK